MAEYNDLDRIAALRASLAHVTEERDRLQADLDAIVRHAVLVWQTAAGKWQCSGSLALFATRREALEYLTGMARRGGN